MSDRLGVSESRRRVVRAGLVLLALGQAGPALWALLAPAGFYATFPGGGHHWVAAMPPYNHHLVTDYGSAYLGLSVMAALAAVFLERRLVQVALVSWAVSALPHLAFHVANPAKADNVANDVVLGLSVFTPLVLLALLRAQRPATAGGPAP
jgi:hypothetical protein